MDYYYKHCYIFMYLSLIDYRLYYYINQYMKMFIYYFKCLFLPRIYIFHSYHCLLYTHRIYKYINLVIYEIYYQYMYLILIFLIRFLIFIIFIPNIIFFFIFNLFNFIFIIFFHLHVNISTQFVFEYCLINTIY